MKLNKKPNNWKGDKPDLITRTIINNVEMFATDQCKNKYNKGNPITVIKINLN